MRSEKKTLRTIGVVVLITLLTKGLAVVREALQANAFGTSPAFDLYSIVYNHSIYLFTTVAYALCIAAVPVISKKLERSREEALRVSGNLICTTVLFCLLLTAALSALVRLAPIHRWLGVAGEDLPTLRLYLQICLLTLPLIVLIYLLVAVFQSMEHYTLQGSLSLPYNLLLILFLLLFADPKNLLPYVIVVCAAWVLQLAMVLPAARKERFRLVPSVRPTAPEYRLFLRTTLVTVFTTSIFLWCYLADSAAVSAFEDGAVSAVYYADKLFTPISTVMIYSISVVLFPKYNQEFARGSEQAYKQYVSRTVENTLFVIFPFSVMMAVFAVPVVHVLYEHGSFDAASTALTGGVLGAYALGMAGFCVLDLLNKAYYTMGKPQIPLAINAVVLALNLIGNALLRDSAAAGTIACGTAAALTVGGLLALVCFFRRERGSLQVSRLVKDLAAALLMGAALWFLSDKLYSPETGKLVTLAEYLGLGALGILLYGGLCWLLGEREALALVSNRLKGRTR